MNPGQTTMPVAETTSLALAGSIVPGGATAAMRSRVIATSAWNHGLQVRVRTHPSDSALLALAAGCPRSTAELIRHQSAPRDPVAGEWLRLADEAS